jgi:hypothetical protein
MMMKQQQQQQQQSLLMPVIEMIRQHLRKEDDVHINTDQDAHM